MSVDFHIRRTGSVSTCDLLAKVKEMLHEVLVLDSDLAVEATAVELPSESEFEPAALLEHEQRFLRIQVGGLTTLLVCHLECDAAPGIKGGRPVFLVMLAQKGDPIDLVAAVVVAEALCSLGGSDIDDERYLTEQGKNLACGQLMRWLKKTERGRDLIRNAQETIKLSHQA